MASKDKYDRQIRLWGRHGQYCLGEGKVIMLGTSSAGTETLKNLVLPGVGQFLIVDDHIVDKRDCGNDFFVTVDSIGKPKAVVTRRLLHELNPIDTKGFSEVCSVADFIDNREKDLVSANLIIVNDVCNNYALKVCKICEQHNIPMLLIRQYGMIGYMRTYKNESFLVEPKEAQKNPRDLRVTAPWPELAAFANQWNFSELDDVNKHNHVPYAAIMIQGVQKWRDSHEGNLPKTFPEKREFKEAFKAMRYNNGEGEYYGPNFAEAIAEAPYNCFAEECIPDGVQEIFNCDKINSHQSNINWGFAAALKKFHEKEGRFPVSGGIPDMVALPEYYLALQKIFEAKATSDKEILMTIYQELLASRDMKLEDVQFDAELFKLFVKNSKLLQLFHMNSLEKEFNEPNVGAVIEESQDPQQNCWKWFIALRAYEQLRVTTKPDIGVKVNDEEDFKQLSEAAEKIRAQFGIESALEDKYLKELLRFGNAKLHNVSAFLGGLGAQEAVKLMMSQYIPFNNTFIYDGITGCGQVFEV